MDGFLAAVSLLPQPLSSVLRRVSPAVAHSVQEIRLRAGQAIALSMGGVTWFVQEDGCLSEVGGVSCREDMLHAAVQRLLQYSVYAHTEELRRGFVTANGCRVGIAGTAVVENGAVTSYRAIDALCLRVARAHPDCARPLADMLCENGTVHSALLCGEPSAGKTSLLRDLAVQLVRKRCAVTVIDERGELGGVGPLAGCDVLRHVPKAIGIEQAVRCLAPQAVLLDELGDTDEIEAVRDGALRGVPAIATVHGRSVGELFRRRALREALTEHVFDYVAVMHGRTKPGCIVQMIRTEDVCERDRCGVAHTHGARLWVGGEVQPAPPLDSNTADRAITAMPGRADPLHGGADE